jgi:hypothetical protein
MTTLHMEVALMDWLNIRQNLVVPNVSWGISIGNRSLHECDIIKLSKSNYATEYEIKVSKSDLIKDKGKRHGHVHNAIKDLYFCVPEKLLEIALDHIPERAGLICVREVNSRFEVNIIRKAKSNKNAIKWPEKARYNLARLGSMRIPGLKRKVLQLKIKLNK